MKIYKLIFKFIFKYKVKVAFYLLLSLALSLLSILAPYISGTFIDNLIINPSTDIIYKFTFIYVCIAVLQLLFSYYITILSTNIQTRTIFDFNKGVINKIHKLSLLFLDTQNVVYLNQRIKADCSTLITFGLSSLCGLIVNSISFIICLIVIINISVQISILILFLIIAYCILYKLIKNPLEKVQYSLKEADAKYGAEQQEQYNKIRIMKVFNLFNFFDQKLYLAFKCLLSASIKSAKFGFLFRSSDTIITMISQIVLFIFGGIQIIQGDLTIGLFTVLSSYFASLVNNTKFFITLGNQYIDCKVSAKRSIELMNLSEESNGKLKLDDINNIKAEYLTFGYSSKSVINNLSIIFEKGNIYKILGSNGKGKTTLINLLIGLYPCSYTGKISYNGIDLNDLDIVFNRHNHICYVGQDSFVFNGTVKENLTLGRSEVAYDIVKKYLEEFHFDIYSEVGYDRFLEIVINQNCTNFSGGELKKLSIIRGLIHPCSLLIMDEPSNSLDVDSKIVLKKYLKKMKTNHIILLVSHDNCYDEIVDKVVEL